LSVEPRNTVLPGPLYPDAIQTRLRIPAAGEASAGQARTRLTPVPARTAPKVRSRCDIAKQLNISAHESLSNCDAKVKSNRAILRHGRSLLRHARRNVETAARLDHVPTLTACVAGHYHAPVPRIVEGQLKFISTGGTMRNAKIHTPNARHRLPDQLKRRAL